MRLRKAAGRVDGSPSTALLKQHDTGVACWQRQQLVAQLPQGGSEHNGRVTTAIKSTDDKRCVEPQLATTPAPARCARRRYYTIRLHTTCCGIAVQLIAPGAPRRRHSYRWVDWRLQRWQDSGCESGQRRERGLTGTHADSNGSAAALLRDGNRLPRFSLVRPGCVRWAQTSPAPPSSTPE